MSEAPIKATLKAGTGYDAPWVTVDGHDPADLKFKLDALVEGGAFDSVVNAANTLKAVNNVAPIAAEVASPPVQQQAQPGGWNTSPVEQIPTWAAQSAQPQQAAPAAQPQQNRSKFAGPPHPEGKTCAICPNVLELKKTSSGKETWRCSEWRWNNGTPNGHSSEWVN